MQSNNIPNKKSNRKMLLIVLLLFVLPAVLAVTMYMTGWRPSATVNHGELIRPAKYIEDRELQSLDGKAVKFSDLHGKWTMVYFDAAACPEDCIKQLYFMRQIHIAQGKNQERVQRVFILTESESESIGTLKAKLTEYPHMLVLKGDKTLTSNLTQDFGISAESGGNQRFIYLLDPQGNLMMRYVPGIEPAGMRKDLERLLKYSND